MWEIKNYMRLKHFYKNEMMKTIEILNEVLNSEKDYLNCKLIDILRSRLCFVYYSMNKYENVIDIAEPTKDKTAQTKGMLGHSYLRFFEKEKGIDYLNQACDEGDENAQMF